MSTQRHEIRMDRRRMVALALFAVACLLALFCAEPAGLRFVLDRTGMSFEMKAPFFQLAFVIGQHCPKMNIVTVLLG